MDQARLRSVPFFSGMSKGELAAIAKQTDEVDAPAGKVLAREGDFGSEFFMIDAGTAEVTRDGEPIAELGAGDFFGEMALFDNQMRSASVRAAEDTECLVLTKWDFNAELTTSPTITHAMFKILARRIRDMQEAPTH
jgi:CRP/FNR family cyclic AMP-dependent transcriptional regulator